MFPRKLNLQNISLYWIKQECKQAFFRAGDFSWNKGT